MLEIYSASWCVHCNKLKSFLKNKGIEFNDIDIDEEIDKAMYLVERGLKTIPQVFTKDGEHIGGCENTIVKFS